MRRDEIIGEWDTCPFNCDKSKFYEIKWKIRIQSGNKKIMMSKK